MSTPNDGGPAPGIPLGKSCRDCIQCDKSSLGHRGQFDYCIRRALYTEIVMRTRGGCDLYFERPTLWQRIKTMLAAREALRRDNTKS